MSEVLVPVSIDTRNHFTPIKDGEVPDHLRNIVKKWRRLAKAHGYSGRIAWRVHEGFYIHPGEESLLYEDGPTKSAIVFWIPHLLNNSTYKTVDEQMWHLAHIREKYGLPEHHLMSFGSLNLLCGLVLAHFQYTHERLLPGVFDCVRTDSGFEDYRAYISRFGEDGLRYGFSWPCQECEREGQLGIFPLGLELDEQKV